MATTLMRSVFTICPGVGLCMHTVHGLPNITHDVLVGSVLKDCAAQRITIGLKLSHQGSIFVADVDIRKNKFECNIPHLSVSVVSSPVIVVGLSTGPLENHGRSVGFLVTNVT
jgi:hypothetical protein